MTEIVRHNAQRSNELGILKAVFSKQVTESFWSQFEEQATRTFLEDSSTSKVEIFNYSNFNESAKMNGAETPEVTKWHKQLAISQEQLKTILQVCQRIEQLQPFWPRI